MSFFLGHRRTNRPLWRRLPRMARFGLRLLFDQEGLLFQPRRELRGSPADAGLAFEEVTLPGGLRGWWIPGEPAAPAVLFLPGAIGNLGGELPTLRFLRSLGAGVLAVDYPGYGRSEGRPSVEGCRRTAAEGWRFLTARVSGTTTWVGDMSPPRHPERSEGSGWGASRAGGGALSREAGEGWGGGGSAENPLPNPPPRCRMGEGATTQILRCAQDDSQRAFQTPSEATAAPPIVVYGRSLGCFFAAKVAAERPAAGLVFHNGFSSAADMAARALHPALVRLLCRVRLSSLPDLARRRCPALFLHGQHDEVVPPDLGRRAWQAAAGPRRFLEVAGGHFDTAWQHDPRVREALREILSGAAAAWEEAA